MTRDLVRLLQRKLASAGSYTGRIDGGASPALAGPVTTALTAAAARLRPWWQDWTDKRKLIAYLQLAAHDSGIDAGAIDGLWGPQTAIAADSLQTLERTGSLPDPWRDFDLRPKPNPNRWPKESQASLDEAFGPDGRPNGRTPDLGYVACPWTLKLAWDRRQTTRRIGCNPKVAESLGRILTRAWEHYGEAELEALRLGLYGGCYNARQKRGGSSLSTHSWAIALDGDADHNQLKWGRDRARLARPEYDPWWTAWEEEGWLGLGRTRNYDWMHVQATAL